MTNGLISSLSRTTFNESAFRADYRQLVINEFALNKQPLDESQVVRLLETAALFALNKDDAYQRLALKISMLLLNQYKKRYDNLSYVVELILTRLGDLPAIRHMVKSKDGKDYFYYFGSEDTDEEQPSDLAYTYTRFPEVLVKKLLNQIMIGNKVELSLTDFQSRLFYMLQKGYHIAFSAPTSSGKSYLLHYYIAHRIINSNAFCAVYIVPTKSLIAEVQTDIMRKLQELEVKPTEAMVFNSASHLNTQHVARIPKKVLVMTQERLQEMLSSNVTVNIDLLVLDEAQKVGDGRRGVILEDTIQELILRYPALQKVFISPNTDPDRFAEIFDIIPQSSVQTIKTYKTPVGQNIFFVQFDRREVKISLRSLELKEDIIVDVRQISRVVPPSPYGERKIWLVKNYLLSNKEPTLVYCNTPSECIKVSRRIAEGKEIMDPSPKITEAIDFLTKHVHPDYYLVDFLKSAIGYHYGRMPQFVRFVVKDLFENKEISALCCTSTLLEGVNLPAKNVVISQPKSGNRQFMDKLSILNLAGRAGRLAKDYYGNVYCIDRGGGASWDDVFDEKPEPVKSSTEETLNKKIDELIAHLESYGNYFTDEDIEGVATSLIVRHLRDPSSDVSQYIRKKLPGIVDEKLVLIIKQLSRIAAEISGLDIDVILKNRSIDPRLQYELYVNLMGEQEIESLLPPEPSEEHLYDKLLKIFEKIARTIFRESHDSYIYYSFLASEWISQKSYKSILENKIRYESNRQNTEKSKEFINEMIDKLDDELETKLKFDYSRGIKCYCDIIGNVLEKRGSRQKVSSDLAVYLEAGAKDPRVLLLLSIGMSRNNAIAVYEMMDPSIDSASECIEWLKIHKEEVINKLGIMRKELDLILGISDQKLSNANSAS